MADEKTVTAPTEDVTTGPSVSVLLHDGHDADGSHKTRRATVDNIGAYTDKDGKLLDPLPKHRLVYVGGDPYEHIADTPDGEWIYANGHSQGR